MAADADRDRLLAGVEVDEARDQTVGEVLPGQILEGADLDHPLVHLEQPGGIDRSDCLGSVDGHAFLLG